MELLNIKITFIDQSTQEEHGAEVLIPIAQEESLSIDNMEQVLVQHTYEAMRQSLSVHFENASKKSKVERRNRKARNSI